MPQSNQTIAGQFIDELNRQERENLYDERDDLRFVNSIIKNNQIDDPNIAGNRELTRESKELDLQDKQRNKSVLEIDEATGSFGKYMIDDKGAIRGDLSFKDIIKGKKELKHLIESIKNSKNKDNDPYIDDYINNFGLKANEGFLAAEKNAKIKYSLIEVMKAIDFLGDNQLESGNYSKYDSQYLIKNAKQFQEASLSIEGDKIVDHFSGAIERIQEKDTMFKALDYLTTDPEAQARLETSPQAMDTLKEAIRLTKTKGNENVNLIQGKLDKVFEIFSTMSKEDRNNADSLTESMRKEANAEKKSQAAIDLTAKNLEARLLENMRRYEISQGRLDKSEKRTENQDRWNREKYIKAQKRLDDKDDKASKDEKLSNFNSYGNQIMENARSIKDTFLNDVVQKNKNFEIFTIKKDALKSPKSRKLALTNNRKNVHSLLRNSGIDFNSTISWNDENYVSDIDINKELSNEYTNMETVMAYFSEGMNEKEKGNRQFQTEGGNKSLGEMRILHINAGNDNETLALQSLLFSMVGFDTHIRSFSEEIVGKEAIVGGLGKTPSEIALEAFTKKHTKQKKK